MAIGRFAGDHLEHWWGSDRLMRRAAALAVVGLAFAGLVPAEWLVADALAADHQTAMALLTAV